MIPFELRSGDEAITVLSCDKLEIVSAEGQFRGKFYNIFFAREWGTQQLLEREFSLIFQGSIFAVQFVYVVPAAPQRYELTFNAAYLGAVGSPQDLVSLGKDIPDWPALKYRIADLLPEHLQLGLRRDVANDVVEALYALGYKVVKR
jgi:hypothetical protein